MSQQEAMRKLDLWLLVPIDENEILPALAELKYTPPYHDYIVKVSKALYKTNDDIERDVDNYIHVTKRELDQKHAELEHKLRQISGSINPDYTLKLNSSDTDDDDVLRAAAGQDYACQLLPEAKKGVNAFSSYLSGYQDGQRAANSAIAIRCKRCGSALQERIVQRATSKNIVYFILLLFFCPILCWIPVIFGRKKQRESYCPKCHIVKSRIDLD